MLVFLTCFFAPFFAVLRTGVRRIVLRTSVRFAVVALRAVFLREDFVERDICEPMGALFTGIFYTGSQ